MKSLAPIANHVQNQFASSAHPLGKDLLHSENKETAARERYVSKQDKDVPDSHRLFRSTQVVHAEVSYRVSSNLNAPVNRTSPQFTPAKFDADAIAKNVMGFVELHVRRAAEDGASPEKIKTMLEQAREGVAKGIDEAKDVLTGLGMLTGDITAGIEDARDAINEGIDDLQEELVDTDPQAAAPSVIYHESQQRMESLVSETFAERKPLNVKMQGLRGAEQYNQYQAYNLSNQFDLQITTQDGDVITINAGYEFGKEESYSEYRDRGSYQSNYQSYEFESYQMSYMVEGELDDDELAALDDFFNQVGELADTFYSGDIQAAFDIAMALEYDKSELASFSLNLSHQESYQMAESYRRVANIPQPELAAQQAPVFDPQSSIIEQLKPLQEFVQKVLTVLEEMFEEQEETAMGDLKKHFPESLVKAIEHHPMGDQAAREDQGHFLDSLHKHLDELIS